MRIIRSALHELRFNTRTAAKKPFSTNKRKINRLKSARTNKNWTVEDWKKVVGADQSTFETGKNSRLVLVCRLVDEMLSSECFEPTFESEQDSVIIWCAFTCERILPIVIVPPKHRTATDVAEIIYDTALGP